MPGGSRKGFPFEREVCRTLSLWWSGGEAEDLFWRTAGSGGRATNRSRKGKTTRNQSGDICATCEEAQPLIDMFTIECKRGYSKHTIHDILDRPPHGKPPVIYDWIRGAIRKHKEAGSKTWMIICMRDRREPLVIMDANRYTWATEEDTPNALLSFVIKGALHTAIVMPLKVFLSEVSPDIVRGHLKIWMGLV